MLSRVVPGCDSHFKKVLLAAAWRVDLEGGSGESSVRRLPGNAGSETMAAETRWGEALGR